MKNIEGSAPFVREWKKFIKVNGDDKRLSTYCTFRDGVFAGYKIARSEKRKKKNKAK